MTSDDYGSTWISRTTPAEDNEWSSVTFGNSLFVAVASSGAKRVMTSSDGIIWASFDLVDLDKHQWTSVIYGNNKFVSVSATGLNRVMTSSDGHTDLEQIPSAAENNNWSSITWGKTSFDSVLSKKVAIQGFLVTAEISENTTTTTTTSVNTVDGIVTNVTVTKQTDAGFNTRTTTTTTATRPKNTPLFVAVASSGPGKLVMTSSDSSRWTLATDPPGSTWNSVTYGAGLFVAVGPGQAMTSIDGYKWTSVVNFPQENWISVTYGYGLFIAVSSYNNYMTSQNGTTWTSRAFYIQAHSYLFVEDTGYTVNQYCTSITFGSTLANAPGTFVAVTSTGNSLIMK